MKIVKIQKKAMMNTVRKYVNEHNELPYELIGYLNYRFLILYKEEEEFKGRESFDELLTGEALYGEYKFRPDKDGLVIISKYTEILQGENVIRQKYNSGF